MRYLFILLLLVGCNQSVLECDAVLLGNICVINNSQLGFRPLQIQKSILVAKEAVEWKWPGRNRWFDDYLASSPTIELYDGWFYRTETCEEVISGINTCSVGYSGMFVDDLNRMMLTNTNENCSYNMPIAHELFHFVEHYYDIREKFRSHMTPEVWLNWATYYDKPLNTTIEWKAAYEVSLLIKAECQ